MGKEFRIALKNAAIIDPSSIDDYIIMGGYEALRQAVMISSDVVMMEILASGLRGRGGAGFLTGLKGKFTKGKQSLKTHSKRYVVCNADEGEPGTFKDRVIMENDPHMLVEGLCIVAYAINAKKAYIYIRGEYYNSIKLVRKALKQAYDNGFIGHNILGSGYSLDIEVRVGAGSYLCGEELTLLESIEGKRGYPRIKPPYPAEIGLFNMPTLINNVETLAHIPSIIINGSKWYKSKGTDKSPGTKIFTVSGDVNKPGHFEVEMGVQLRDLIYDFAGGMIAENGFKAALVGGAAGMFIPESFLHLSMDFNSLEKNGFVLGSGAIIVMNEDRSVFGMLESILEFFLNESCGKCVPCRVGTKQLTLILKDLLYTKNIDVKSCLDSMLYQAELMAKTSLCPLGQSPVMSVKSAIRYFEYEIFNSLKFL